MAQAFKEQKKMATKCQLLRKQINADRTFGTLIGKQT
jgi:hypothetical protein